MSLQMTTIIQSEQMYWVFLFRLVNAHKLADDDHHSKWATIKCIVLFQSIDISENQKSYSWTGLGYLGLTRRNTKSQYICPVLFLQQASIVRVTRYALKRINTKSQYICSIFCWQQASIFKVTRCALKRINTKSQYICSILCCQHASIFRVAH